MVLTTSESNLLARHMLSKTSQVSPDFFSLIALLGTFLAEAHSGEKVMPCSSAKFVMLTHNMLPFEQIPKQEQK